MEKPTIVCFGEVLWDLLPTGKVAGGAPMNVAYHAKQLGINAQMISSVGQDEAGEALLQFLSEKGIPVHLIQKNGSFPTGVVHVQLDEKGGASYEIVEGVAWDHIQLNTSMLEAVNKADAIVFGSLACRSLVSRATLFALLEAAPLRVFDVNFREPFFSKAAIEALLSKADIVKTNEDELAIMAEWYGIDKDIETATAYIKALFHLQKVIVTRGGEGAHCLDEVGHFANGGFPVKVKDTVGSGDSFLAGFLSKMLTGENTQDSLQFACAVGALVATKSGGTPTIDEQMVLQFMEHKGLR